MRAHDLLHTMRDARLLSQDQLQDFILRSTQPSSPSLVPELRLHLAHEVYPLWAEVGRLLQEQEGPLPYWAFAWAGGQALARFLLDHPHLVAHKRVLDLASGSGLVGLAAAKAQADHVLCVDVDPLATAATLLNARLNNLHVEAATADLLGRLDLDAQVILAGDICYDLALTQRAIPWLQALVSQGAQVWIGDPGRNYLPSSGLLQVAHHHVPTSLDLEDALVRSTRVFQLLPP